MANKGKEVVLAAARSQQVREHHRVKNACQTFAGEAAQ